MTWRWDYDYADRRVREYAYPVGTATTASAYTSPSKLYIWSGTQIVQVRSGANVIQKTYFDEGWVEGAAGSGTTAAKYYTLKDHLGSVRQVLDANQKLRATHDYDAYGAEQRTTLLNPQSDETLKVWLKTDSGLIKDAANAVTQWGNQGNSGSAGNMVPYGVAATRPLWVANGLNGRPVIRFDGLDDALGGSLLGFDSVGEDHTVVIVHRRTADVPDSSLLTFSGFNEPPLLSNGYEGTLSLTWRNQWNDWKVAGLGVSAQLMGGASTYSNRPNVETAPDNVGEWQITTMVVSDHQWLNEETEIPFNYGSRFSRKILLRNQGAKHRQESTQTDSPYYRWSNNRVGLGLRTVVDGVPEGYFQGEIAEVMIYSRALGADEQAQVENYLGTRHGIIQDKPSDFRYTGHHYHEGSGLHLALYRAYDAELGRWLSEDPLGEQGGLNLYGYVGNSPVMAVDPLGLAWYDWTDWNIPQGVTDFTAGMGDAASFGLTDYLREMNGLNEGVDKCSDDYRNGQRTQQALDLATLGGSAALTGLKYANTQGLRNANNAYRRWSRANPGVTGHHKYPLSGHPGHLGSAPTYFPSQGLGAYANSVITKTVRGPRSSGYMSPEHLNMHKSFYQAERLAVGGALGRSWFPTQPSPCK